MIAWIFILFLHLLVDIIYQQEKKKKNRSKNKAKTSSCLVKYIVKRKNVGKQNKTKNTEKILITIRRNHHEKQQHTHIHNNQKIMSTK